MSFPQQLQVLRAISDQATKLATGGNGITATAASASPSSPGESNASESAKRAELSIIELDEAAAKISADVDKHRQLVTAEEAVATTIGDHVTDLQNTLAESNDQLQQMREAAGLNDTSGVGAEKKKLTDDLNEARARLQYLEDRSKGTAEDLKAIETQKKAVDDLTAQLTDAEKRLRIADYELTHSDAWQKELQAIAEQQAVIKAEQQKQADEKKRLDAMKADLAEREAKAQKIADERAAQQAIIDKQQQEAQAAATAQRKADLQKELGDVALATKAHVGIIHSAAADAAQKVQDVVTDAGTQLEDTAAQVSQTIASTATQAVAETGAAIQKQLSSAMQSLLDLVAGGPQDANASGDSTKDREYGSQFAGQFRDEQGNIAGGSIGDPTYASYVQSFAASKKRSAADYAAGKGMDQAREAQFQSQLETIWVQLGGFARFHETLEQIVRMLDKQGTAISGISRTPSASYPPRSAPPPSPTARPPRGQLWLNLPKKAPVVPKKDDPRTQMQVMIRTGQL